MAAKPIIVVVTGHRLNQLPEAERPRIARDVGRAVAQIGEAAEEAVGKRPLVLASGVAEGADWYAAAKVWSVTPEQVAAAGGGSAAPYAALARELAAMADVVIAVWSGNPPAGPGGTAEVAALAHAAGAPVLWTPTQEHHAPRLIPGGVAKRAATKSKLSAALAERYDVIAKPDAMRVAEAK